MSEFHTQHANSEVFVFSTPIWTEFKGTVSQKSVSTKITGGIHKVIDTTAYKL